MVDFVRADSSLFYPDFAAALSRVCHTINWDYGEVWLLDSETKLLEISPIWYGHQDRSNDRLDDLRKFKACSEKFVLSIDEGLPGRIWRSRQPKWINDVSSQSENYFLRNQIAKAFNLKAGFGFSVFCDQEVIGIFTFFTDRACEEDPNLVQRAIAAASPFEHPDLYVI